MTILQRQILKVVDNWSIISTAVASPQKLKLEAEILIVSIGANTEKPQLLN